MHKLTIPLILSFLLILPLAGNAKEIYLDTNTALVPQGWSVVDDDLKFKKNTVAELNNNEEVIRGILKSDYYLRPAGWKNIINDVYLTETNQIFFPRFFYPIHTYNNFALPTYGHIRYKGNNPVTFNKQGLVTEGVIDESVTLSLQNNKYGFISLKKSTLLTFDNDGNIISGILDKDTKLRPVGWENNLNLNSGFVEFKKNTKITFTNNGSVESGMIKETIQWKKSDNSTVTLLKDTLINFNNL